MDNEISIQVKNMGFTFHFDKRMKHNLICPDFLAFFKEEYPPTEEEYQANQLAVEKLVKESKEAFPILPGHLKYYHFKGVLKRVGYGVVRCSDNVFRRCNSVKFNFEYEKQSSHPQMHPYSGLFFIDKSLRKNCTKHCAILGSHFCNRPDAE